MKVLVEFTKDFADMKKGDRVEYSSELASTLIRVDKVAKVYKKASKK